MTLGQALETARQATVGPNEVTAIYRRCDPGLGYIVKQDEGVRARTARARGANRCDRIRVDLALEDFYGTDWEAVTALCADDSISMTKMINLLPVKGGAVISVRQVTLDPLCWPSQWKLEEEDHEVYGRDWNRKNPSLAGQ